MIKLITDIQDGETDLLEDCKFNDLIIRDLEGETLHKEKAPSNSWCHENLSVKINQLANLTLNTGGDAFLGGCWIGSSEV